MGKGQTLTLLDKMWDSHLVAPLGDRSIVYIDRHFLHEATSFQAFEMLRSKGLRLHAPKQTLGVIDHCLSSAPGRDDSTFAPSTRLIRSMRRNCEEFGVELVDIPDRRQGIVHVIAPELGFALPGSTFVCGDSHTATCGGLGALAFGIGTSQVAQVMASQALLLRKPKALRVRFNGALPPGVFAKDLILGLIGQHGTALGTGYAVEYAGSAIDGLSVEGRMTICNMSIEFGAPAGFVRADDKTFDFLAGRPFAPRESAWEDAVARWRKLASDDGAVFDKEVEIDCSALAPQISWGTSPHDMIAIDAAVPDPASIVDPDRRLAAVAALQYMGLVPGTPIAGTPIDFAFIGSCTNGRLSDLQEAASILRGRKVHQGVRALVVPGSSSVKRQAEELGLDKVFRTAGFEWREPGCSMCVSANGDVVPPEQRSVSTTNRNFEGRQGPGSRTHITSPAMVAAAAVAGCIIDVRKVA